jgi:hypothetical protein
MFQIKAADLNENAKGKVIPVLNKSPSHEDVWKNGGINPRFIRVG